MSSLNRFKLQNSRKKINSKIEGITFGGDLNFKINYIIVKVNVLWYHVQ